MENKIELSSETLTELLKLSGLDASKCVDEDSIKEQIIRIKTSHAMNVSDEVFINEFNSGTNNILVVDDIGVVTYQLKILLRNIGYNVQTAKDIFSGLNTFIKTNYSFLIMDLFVSTEQEGYTLLSETKKIITKNNLATKIIVITASNKAENKIKCLNSGADMFLKKDTGWQDKLIEMIENYQYQGAPKEL